MRESSEQIKERAHSEERVERIAVRERENSRERERENNREREREQRE